MHKRLVAVTGLILLGAAMSLAAPAADQPARMGTWSLNNWTSGDRVRLTLSYRHATSRWEWTSDQPVADFEGLTTAQRRAVRSSAAFTMKRDAGTFTFEGTFMLGVGRGDFRFTPDPTYAGRLSALGYEKVEGDAVSIMMLAARDVSLAYAKEVKDAGLEDLKVSDLMHLLDHGVESDLLRAVKSAGDPHPTADDVVNLHDHGVDGRYLRAMKAAGPSDPSPAGIIELHDHGVGADYVAGLHAAGHGNLTVDQIIDLHDHGVRPDYVARLHAAGYGDLTVDQIIKLHDHGVD